MTTYEAIAVILQSNLVLIAVITLILKFVKRKK
ncbi:putative holin-like toxin [Alkalihalobacterium elongatum]|nr:putative holin-like toxin [Alkalihalobacterium elongatum]